MIYLEDAVSYLRKLEEKLSNMGDDLDEEELKREIKNITTP